MADLETLKRELRREAAIASSSPNLQVSSAQYSAGFNLLLQGSGWTIYQDFIIPQLSQLVTELLRSRDHVSVLEIGPGPKSILGYLPGHLRRKIKKYTAYEPNDLFARNLREWLDPGSQVEPRLPNLERPPEIHQAPFTLHETIGNDRSASARDNDAKYDIVLFSHSLYGMKPKHKFIESALAMLVEQPQDGLVVVFHRDSALNFNGLVCHQTASFPKGVISVANNDEALDNFTPFIAGFVVQDANTDQTLRAGWRRVCRALARYEEAYPGQLLFSAPEIMIAFNKHATSLPELIVQVPMSKESMMVKNREACRRRPAAVVRPTNIQNIQQCVKWALKHGVALTIIGGGHSGHCIWPNVVSVDMSAFNQINIHKAEKVLGEFGSKSGSRTSVVVVEAGCQTGDIVRKLMAAGIAVPLGARPSVGAGLWLQGGLGHLARTHGLTCDTILGAIVVSVKSGELLCIGYVPNQYKPAGAVCPENESDILWAMRGAGTNFGIVVSVTFKSHAAPRYQIQKQVAAVRDSPMARLKLCAIQSLAKTLDRARSIDGYLYWNDGQLHLGEMLFECNFTAAMPAPAMTANLVGGLEDSCKTVDGVGLFDSEMYVSDLHGGHGGGKTSSFKRCLFLRNITDPIVADHLLAAIESRPTPFCYLHLLHGGGAIGDVAADATAFGCRDWEFATVITGVWPRDQDGTEAARSAVQWVYSVASYLLPLSSGAYGADLGPDPRDAALAVKAFGPNRARLGQLKHELDPYNVLAYACPLPRRPAGQKLIILVTGESCAGKDYCADVWVSEFIRNGHTARVLSISDATKREYAAVTGADISRLLWDREYKEQHRPALTRFFQDQVRQRPNLPEDTFRYLIDGAVDVEVLLITGMREKAPVAAFSQLVSESRLLEVYVQARESTQWMCQNLEDGLDDDDDDSLRDQSNRSRSDLTAIGYQPSIIFQNATIGDRVAQRFGEKYLLPFMHEDLKRLAGMASQVHDFPRPGIEFRHVLGISQQRGGLALCTSLLKTHFLGDWTEIDAIACCEVGGLIFASALAVSVDVPLALIREAGKLPLPTILADKPRSFISSSNTIKSQIEMGSNVIPRGSSVVVVDDVLSTGETLCGVLRLLCEAGIGAEDVSIMVVAEFPAHLGRERLQQQGFGKTKIQSLLVFGGL